MARDGEIPAIFNPRKVRAPSVVVTGDSPNGPFQLPLQQPTSGGNTPTTNTASNQQQTPQITHSDSVASSQPDATEASTGQILAQCDTPTTLTVPQTPQSRSRWKRCKASCCSELAQKIYFGVAVTVLVTASWVCGTHAIKYLYSQRFVFNESATMLLPDDEPLLPLDFGQMKSRKCNCSRNATIASRDPFSFSAPFFTSWFFTNFMILFFPIYMMGRCAVKKCEGSGEAIGDILRGFRDRGFTIGRFLNRCMSFCVLWLIATYLYVLALESLCATDVLALFATNVASVYLLSWVILHEQFVGIRIVAVILCDTGIALLAYMDGITGSPTLLGVVLAALAGAGYAVFRVMFRKVMGDPPIGQIAFTFTVIGFLNAAILWPVCVGLYFSGHEKIPPDLLPWIMLLIASILLLVFHLLTQFGSAVTYNMFVTLGLITSVPVSAALDLLEYQTSFASMKLAGIILIGIGFFLVMFPNNWPDYITRLLRNTGRAFLRSQCCCDYADYHYEHSKYHLIGTQREMGAPSSKRNSWDYRRRLSNGVHTLSPKVSERASEMTDQPYISLDAQQFNLNLTKPKVNYGADRVRHSFSVAESHFIRPIFNDTSETFASLE